MVNATVFAVLRDGIREFVKQINLAVEGKVIYL